MALPVRLDAHGGLQCDQLHALGDRALDLLGQRGHILPAAAIDAAHLTRAEAHCAAAYIHRDAGDARSAQTDRASCHVHRDVAAADDHDLLAAEIGHVIVADLAQHLNRGHDALGVLAFDAGLFIRVCAECKIERVVLTAQLVEGDLVSDVHIDLRINADGEERRDLRVQDLARQTVGGNAVAQHTAELRPLFIHRNLVAHQREIVRRGKTARPAADDGDRLAGLLSAGGMGHIARVVHRVALESANVHRVVDHVAAAARLTGMLADVRAGGGQDSASRRGSGGAERALHSRRGSPGCRRAPAAPRRARWRSPRC